MVQRTLTSKEFTAGRAETLRLSLVLSTVVAVGIVGISGWLDWRLLVAAFILPLAVVERVHRRRQALAGPGSAKAEG